MKKKKKIISKCFRCALRKNWCIDKFSMNNLELSSTEKSTNRGICKY